MNQRSHKRILAECLHFLSVNGVEVTPAVEELIRYFFAVDEHLSIEDVQRNAKEKNLEVTPTEIKGTLDLLVEYGFASRKVFGTDTVLFEHLHLGQHHDHLYCVKCGKIIEFFSYEIEDLQSAEADARGFHAFSHKMQIYGLCDTCFGAASHALVPLALVEPGGRFQIVDISAGRGHGGKGARKRLADVGIVPGLNGEVINNSFGMTVVNLDGNRVALRKGQSQKVLVTLKN